MTEFYPINYQCCNYEACTNINQINRHKVVVESEGPTGALLLCQLGVARRGVDTAQDLDNVQWDAADSGQNGHLPNECPRQNERQVKV